VTADRFAGIVADVDAVPPWLHACAALARSRFPSGPSHGIAPENASGLRAEAFCFPAISFVQLAKDFGMAKRSTREAPAHSSGGAVAPLFGPTWHPLAVERDSTREQSYLRKVRPQSDGQRALMAAIERHSLTLALGPAGTGKTYLAITAAVEALEAGKVGRIVLTRPAIEAGESLGFLPGDLHEKLAPYLRPLYDALNDRIGGKRLRQLMTEGAIEIAPVAYMRGRTLNNAFVVIDEAQNCTYGQIKMLLTRLGWHSTMILTGDPDQSDLLEGLSGFADIARRLEVVPEVAVVRLSDRDIVRHPLVASMLTVL
jgi:phosphate starvation-inducible PhoH-like protein